MGEKLENNKHKIMLYVEAILYIIFIALIIFLNIYGMIQIRMIPLLFILGIVGKIVFDRPVSTSLFGAIISFLFLMWQARIALFESSMYSLYIAILIGMGEVLGGLIEKIYDDFKNIKSMKKTKRAFIYFLTLIFVILPIYVNAYTNGDIFSYNKAKIKLNGYIEKTYSANNFKIVSSNYKFYKYRGYTFDVQKNDDGDIYRFIVYSNDNILDGYKEDVLDSNNSIINNQLSEYIKQNSINEKYPDFNITATYNTLDELNIDITKNAQIVDDASVEKFAKQTKEILDILKDFEKYSEITQAKIKITGTTNNILESTIQKSDFNNDYVYIVHSLKVEYIG